MSTLSILLPLIKRFEGCKLEAYQCPAGVWTIGYGCTGSDIKQGVVWTQEKADSELEAQASACLAQALKSSRNLVSASANRQAAVADFIFNLGLGAYRASTLKKHVDASDWQSAKESVKLWDKARVNGELKILPGLVKRRQAESDLLA